MRLIHCVCIEKRNNKKKFVCRFWLCELSSNHCRIKSESKLFRNVASKYSDRRIHAHTMKLARRKTKEKALFHYGLLCSLCVHLTRPNLLLENYIFLDCHLVYISFFVQSISKWNGKYIHRISKDRKRVKIIIKITQAAFGLNSKRIKMFETT